MRDAFYFKTKVNRIYEIKQSSVKAGDCPVPSQSALPKLLIDRRAILIEIDFCFID